MPSFKQIVGGFRAFGIFLIALRESGRGVAVILADVERLAEPILRIAGERILGIALNESAHRLLGGRIIRLGQQAHSVIVLVLRIAGGQRPARSGGLLRRLFVRLLLRPARQRAEIARA